MRARWRVLKYACQHPAANMALDEALFEQVRAGDSPVLRLYSWQSPAITVGRFQSLKRTVNLEEAARLNLPIIRRITGGRGILHGEDLTIGILCKVEHLGLSAASAPSISLLYSVITDALSAALRTAGIQAVPGSNSNVRRDAASITGDCFALVASSDLVAGEAKRLGGAMHRADEHILFQASIPVGSPPGSPFPEMAHRVFTGAAAVSDTNSIDMTLLSAAIVEAWSATFASETCSEQADIDTQLEHRTNQLTRDRYIDTDWTESTRKQFSTAELN